MRVRRAAEWKPEKRAAWISSIILTLALVVFCYCGGPTYDYREAEGTAEPAWSDFLARGDWELYVSDLVGEPREVWSRSERQLIVLNDRGEWYTVRFDSWSGEYYSHTTVVSMKQAFLEGCTRIA